MPVAGFIYIDDGELWLDLETTLMMEMKMEEQAMTSFHAHVAQCIKAAMPPVATASSLVVAPCRPGTKAPIG